MPEERLELPQGTLDLLILKALALESMQGWAISERLRQISREALQVQQGSLYPALHRANRHRTPVSQLYSSGITVVGIVRMKGFPLSIDDFGTGYSSMVQLVRLPFSEIKIDKSFVMQAQNSAESRSVIQSSIELGHSLGLVVTG